ncbi:MAG: hypothetical protein MJ188_10590 [Treponema sp.]|nr:hypothetical protein [Treponema sp.]
MLKKYSFGFDFLGLSLFVLVMIPNFIWFAVPAPNDILRTDSLTPIIDVIGSISQVIFIAAMCMLVKKDVEKIRFSKLIIAALIMVVLYFTGWILYYCDFVNSAVIILLTIPPCTAFILYTVDRKNFIAVIPGVIFTICHIIYGAVNFI